MTWINRLRLLAGLLGVLLLVAVLTLIFNQRQTKAASLSATIRYPSARCPTGSPLHDPARRWPATRPGGCEMHGSGDCTTLLGMTVFDAPSATR